MPLYRLSKTVGEVAPFTLTPDYPLMSHYMLIIIRIK
jgi:hypothetical protein